MACGPAGLACVSSDGRDDLFKALAIEVGSFDGLVQVRDVGVVVLPVVKLERGAGNVGLQRVNGVRELGKGMGHEKNAQRRDPNESPATSGFASAISPSPREVPLRRSALHWAESHHRHHGLHSPDLEE